VKLVEFYDRPPLRAKPGQRKTFNRPRENAVPICLPEIFHRQLIAERDNIVGVIKIIAKQDPFGKIMRARIWEINQRHETIKPQRDKETEFLNTFVFIRDLSHLRRQRIALARAGTENAAVIARKTSCGPSQKCYAKTYASEMQCQPKQPDYEISLSNPVCLSA
jgi:hypothetical protein